MKTITIEIDGEKIEANMYESMWDYVSEWDITHYVMNCMAEDAPRKFVEPFKPVDDVDLGVKDTYEIDGKTYAHVNGGESAVSLIPYEELEDEFWTIFEANLRRNGEWNSNGAIFQTREDAEKELI